MRELITVEIYRLNYVDIVDRLSLWYKVWVKGNEMIWLEAIRAKALYYIYINTKAVNGDTCPWGYARAMSHQMVE